MCFTKELSLTSLIVGIGSSLALFLFGNKKVKNTNLAICLFFLFVSFMQFFDLMMWSDQRCQSINRLASIAGPLFNHLQPVVFLLLSWYFVGSNHMVPSIILVPVNILYCVYVADRYKHYLETEDLCTETNEDNQLDWEWKYNFNYTIFFCVSLLNYINFFHDINIVLVVAFSYLLMFASNQWKQNNGQIWCVLVTSVPLVPLLFQTFFSK